MPEGAAWVRVSGDGLAVEGPCLLLGILWRCDKNDDECLVYDGLDPTSGKPFTELVGDGDSFYHFDFGDGVEFASGVYIDQTRADDKATIYFRQDS